jgi:hypothetical protein
LEAVQEEFSELDAKCSGLEAENKRLVSMLEAKQINKIQAARL